MPFVTEKMKWRRISIIIRSEEKEKVMRKKMITAAAVIGGVLCIADGLMDLGLSSDILNRHLNGILGIVFLMYGILIHTKYENSANGILYVIIGGTFIYEFFCSTWTGNPFKFFDLIVGICVIGIGVLLLLPVKTDE